MSDVIVCERSWPAVGAQVKGERRLLPGNRKTACTAYQPGVYTALQPEGGPL